MMRKRFMPLAVLMAAGAVALSAGHAVASPASQASTRTATHAAVSPANTTKDGVCEDGEFCLFSGAGGTGLVFDTTGGDSNITNEAFPENQGLLVSPNAQSASNLTDKTWAAFDGIDFTGKPVCVAPGQTIDLSDTFEVLSVSSAGAEDVC